MTQTALDAFGHTPNNDETDETATKNGAEVTVIATGHTDKYNDNADAVIDAAGINPDAHDELDALPRHTTDDDGWADLAEPLDEPIRIQGGRDRAQIHALPVTWGAEYDRIMSKIGEIIGDAAAGDTTDVLAYELSHIGRDTVEIADRIDTLLDAGVTVWTREVTISLEHADVAGDLVRAVGDAGPGILPMPDATDLVNANNRVGGRPPIGFEYSSDGDLTTTDDYLEICQELSKRAKGEQSQRQTARAIGCAARTVKRAIEDHPDRYQL